jgi:uncharacterized membrane protein YfcA
MEILFILLCLLTGFISGVCAGFFGIGGGVINVPFLIAIFYFFHESGDPIKKSIVSSLAVVFIASLSSSYTHFKSNKNLLLKNLFIIGFAGGIGAILGAHIAISIKSIYLKKALGVLEIIASLYILLQQEKENGQKETKPLLPGIFAFLAGIFSATFGIGGGIVFIPLTRLTTNYPLTDIIGYSSGMIPFVSLFGLSQYLWFEFSRGQELISIHAIIPMAITCIIGARLGAKGVYLLNKERLKIFYSIFLFIIGCLLIYR